MPPGNKQKNHAICRFLKYFPLHFDLILVRATCFTIIALNCQLTEAITAAGLQRTWREP